MSCSLLAAPVVEALGSAAGLEGLDGLEGISEASTGAQKAAVVSRSMQQNAPAREGVDVIAQP
jgi:hypothetical protein